MNLPPTIAAVVSSPMRLATLHDLQTIYGTQDLFDFLEMMDVEAQNQAITAKLQD